MGFKKIVKITAKLDVLLGAGLLIAYVSVMSENLPELQIVKGSRRDHAVIYIYVAFTTVVQIFISFKYYRDLTLPAEDEEGEGCAYLEKLLRMSKIWIIVSYLLLLNWIIKAGIYSQQGQRRISIALTLYLIEIAFRICSISIVNSYISRLEKEVEEKKSKIRLKSLVIGSRKKSVKKVEVEGEDKARY